MRSSFVGVCISVDTVVSIDTNIGIKLSPVDLDLGPQAVWLMTSIT